MTKITIEVNWSSPGFHFWPEAPKEVKFLSYPHRHLFYFTVWAKVQEKDRELEFFLLQKQMKTLLGTLYGELYRLGFDFLNSSCEHIASRLLRKSRGAIFKIRVSEDQENAAIVERGEE